MTYCFIPFPVTWLTARHALPLLACLLATLLALPASATPIVKPGLREITICHGFGCHNRDILSISAPEWREIEAFFATPAASAEAEREQIRRAAGWFEVIAGRHTPIYLDKGQNYYPDRYNDGNRDGRGRLGQMDCIDESLNMQSYLKAMEQAGLFHFHHVVERALRQSAVDQHYAGQIEVNKTGERWVVDSWFYDYGSLPYIAESREWHDIPFLFSTSFPEAADD